MQYKGIFNWRNNTGAAKIEGGGFVRFGSVGSPDIFAVKNGKVWGIEVKTAKGELSQYQKHWGELFSNAGGIYVVVRSLDEIMKIL